MASVTRLNASFGADASNFLAGTDKVLGRLSKVDRAVEISKTRWGKFQSQLSNFGSKVADAFKRFHKAAMTALAGPMAVMGTLSAAAVGASTALWKLTRAGADIVDPFAKLSDSLSMGTGELMGLVHGADLAGASAEDLQRGFERMLRSIHTGSRAFEDLGLDVAELQGMGTVQAFETIADRIADIEDPVRRVGAALEIFGRRGATLLPFMMGGSEAMREASEEAKALGFWVDRIDAWKIEQFNDALTRMGRLWEGIKVQIAVHLAPLLEGAITRLVEFLKSTGGAGEWVRKGVDMAIKGIASLLDSFGGWRLAFEQAKAWILELGLKATYVFDHMRASAIDSVNQVIKSINRIPGINVPRAEVGAATDRSELLADLIATGKRIENLKSRGRPGEQFQLMALEWLRQSDERAREALSKPPAIPPGLLAALEDGEGLDAESVHPVLDKLDEVAKGKGLESLGDQAHKAADGFGALAESIDEAHEAAQGIGRDRFGTGSIATTAFPGLTPAAFAGPGAGAGVPHIVPPQVQVPHRGSQLDVQYLRQIAATLVQMAHRQAATPMIGIV